MAHVSVPHVWVPGEILTAADLNALVAAIVAQVNGNLDNSNIATTAAIVGSKLADAPSGVTTGKINDLAVTAAKLAADAVETAKILDANVTPAKLSSDAVVRNFTSGVFATVAGLTAQGTVLTLPSITTVNGFVLLTGTGSVQVTVEASGAVVTWRAKRDGVTFGTWAVNLMGGPGAGGTIFPMFTPTVIDVPTPGAHVYTLTLQVAGTGASATIPASDQGVYHAIELGTN